MARPKPRVGWTAAELAELQSLYAAHRGGIIPLAAWAVAHHRDKTNVARKARQFGFTDAARPRRRPRQPRAKHATDMERRAAIGAATRERLQQTGHPRGMLGKHHGAETRVVLGRRSQAFWTAATPAQREAMVAKRNRTNIARYGTAAPGFGRTEQPFSRCRGGRRTDLGDQYFRSAWEANYARYLNFLLARGEILEWEYEAKTFIFPGVTRGAITYTPDFRVVERDGSEIFHEVKGWMTSKSRTCLRRMGEHYPEVRLRVVGEPEYRALARQCKGLVAGWE